jgi:hypothetical protein
MAAEGDLEGIRTRFWRPWFRLRHPPKEIPVHKRHLLLAFSVVALVVTAGSITMTASGKSPYPRRKTATPPVNVTVFSPRKGDIAGKESKGFFVDLAVRYRSLASSGADFQLTGPGAHQNQAPFPGAFAPGVDEKLPGLIVLLSTSTVGARNAQNLAGLFNLTGFTNQKTNEIWDTWIVGAPSFGRNVRSVLRVAVAADKNKDRIYNDAPAVVPDANRDGHIDGIDLKAYGVASNIAAVPFEIRD